MAGMRDGHRNECKCCNLAQQHERYKADPARAKARVKQWQQENADRVNAYWRKRRQEPEVKARERDSYLKRRFGISLREYEEMLASQKVSAPFVSGRRRPVFHSTSTMTM